MKQIQVYDLPTRIFHWSFATLFITSFAIGKIVDDKSALFAYHSLSGILMASIVVLRIAWGVVGSRHARFSSFALYPKQLLQYLKDVKEGGGRKWAGHNPASSWAALIMILLALGLATTGYLVSVEIWKKSLEEVHEVFGILFAVTALFHVAGVILHTIRYKDPIGLSMLNGRKNGIADGDAISSNHGGVAILFIGFILSFGVYLVNHYDQESRSLNLFGTVMQLGENKQNENHSLGNHNDTNDHDDDNDD